MAALSFRAIGVAEMAAVEESLARQAAAAITPCTMPRPGHEGRHWQQGRDIGGDCCTGCGIQLR